MVDKYLEEEEQAEKATMEADDIDASEEAADAAQDELAEEDSGLAEPKKPGLLSKLFAPIPPSQLPPYVPGSERPPEPVPDNLDGSAGDEEDEDADEDITEIPAEDEEWLYGTKDIDTKTGEDFLAAPSDEMMADLTGTGREKKETDFITGVSKEDEEFLTGTTMKDSEGDDFLAAPSGEDIDDLLDIGSDDPFLFSTGDDEDEDGEGNEEEEGEQEDSEGEGAVDSETVEQPIEPVAGQTPKCGLCGDAVATIGTVGGLDERMPGTAPQMRPKVRYTVGKPKKVKSREQQDKDTDEFLFGTKGVL